MTFTNTSAGQIARFYGQSKLQTPSLFQPDSKYHLHLEIVEMAGDGIKNDGDYGDV